MSSPPRPELSHPPSPGLHPGEGAAPLPPPPNKRRGSEKRQREHVISVRVYDNERLAIEANAAGADLCASAYLRMLGTGAPRAQERRRPDPDMKAVSKLLGECGRIGGNVHQLVKGMNMGLAPDSAEMDAAGKEVRALFAAVFTALGI